MKETAVNARVISQDFPGFSLVIAIITWRG